MCEVKKTILELATLGVKFPRRRIFESRERYEERFDNALIIGKKILQEKERYDKRQHQIEKLREKICSWKSCLGIIPQRKRKTKLKLSSYPSTAYRQLIEKNLKQGKQIFLLQRELDEVRKLALTEFIYEKISKMPANTKKIFFLDENSIRKGQGQYGLQNFAQNLEIIFVSQVTDWKYGFVSDNDFVKEIREVIQPEDLEDILNFWKPEYREDIDVLFTES